MKMQRENNLYAIFVLLFLFIFPTIAITKSISIPQAYILKITTDNLKKFTHKSDPNEYYFQENPEEHKKSNVTLISVQGNAYCHEKGDIKLEKPAYCLIVFPQKRGGLCGITTPSGYFQFIFPYNEIIDKKLILDFRYYNGHIQSIPMFVSEENLLLSSRKEKTYLFRCGTVEIEKNCECFENDCKKTIEYFEPSKIEESVFANLISDIGWNIPTTCIIGSCIACPILVAMNDDADDRKLSAPSPTIDILDINSLSSPKNINGKFLSLALDGMVKNVGFQFSPTRNMGDSVFFNSSAISLSRYRQINFHSDFNKYSQISLCCPFKDDLGFGIGFMRLKQNEKRIAFTELNESATSDLKTDELGTFISLSKRVRDDFSFGLTYKLISQRIDSPSKIIKATYDYGGGNIVTRYGLSSEKKEKTYMDFDLSATYQINSQFQVGCSLMNIAGTELLTEDNKKEAIRSCGIGLSYKIKRIHFGSDIKFNQGGKIDTTIGMNIVPFSNAEFNIGYGAAFDSFTIGAKYKIKVLENTYASPTYSFVKNNVLGEFHFLGISANF